MMSGKMEQPSVNSEFNEPLIEPTNEPGVNQRRPNTSLLFSALSASMWSEGKQKAETVYRNWSNIDIFRPNFDVDPQTVVKRLIMSLNPDIRKHPEVTIELYGPLMIVLTLVAALLFEMKVSDHKVQEGTLMGLALITVFGYWMFLSFLLWALSFIGAQVYSVAECFSVVGYSMSSHCIVTLLSVHGQGSWHYLQFLPLWLIFCGCAAARLATIIFPAYQKRKEAIIAIGIFSAIHMLYGFYLHHAFHTVVEVVTESKTKGLVSNIQG